MRKILSSLLCLAIILPVFEAGARGKKQITAVAIPVHNNNSDNLTDNATVELGRLLGKRPDFYVVEKKKVTSVLKYHDRVSPDSERSSALERLAKAKDNYYRFNYVEAKSIVGSVIKSINDKAIFDNGDLLIDAYLALGIIAKSMGNIGDARQAFAQALRLDPEYILDSRAFPPSLINLFENVKSSVQIQPSGKVKVETSPKAVEVYLNGILKGATPITLNNLPEGRHYVKLSANKYKTIMKEIVIEPRAKIKVRENMIWLGGKRGELTGKEHMAAASGMSQNDQALRVADLLKVDKVILVDVDDAESAAGVLSVKMIDREYRTGQSPIVLQYKDKFGSSENALEEAARKIESQTLINIANNPPKYADPPGAGDTVLMGTKKRHVISKPLLYGIIGGVALIGVGAGLAAAMAGGSSGSDTGSLNVTFK